VDAPGALPELASPALIDQAQDRGALSLERANLYRVYALTGDDRLPAAYDSDVHADATFLVRRVQGELAAMDPGPARRAVSAAVSAPAPLSACFTSAAPLTNTLETAHFVIQYNAAALAASPEPLTIQQIEQSLETAWTTEVDQFGWAAPPATVLAAQDLAGRYHVRIDNALGPAIYGFVANSGTYAGRVGNNPATSWDEGDADASCMVLNGNFSQFPGTAQDALDATTAHEFNHSLQYGYGALSGLNRPDLNFSEGATTWMEDEVQDSANDNYNYLYPEFDSSMGEHGGSEYAYWLTFRGLTERFGTNAAGGGEDVMQAFWELTSRNAASMLTAMQGALAGRGISLASAYHDYAIAAKFNAPCGAAPGAYALPLCFEEGAQYVAFQPKSGDDLQGETLAQRSIAAVPAATSGSVEDNYALNWVSLPTTGSYDVTVSNTSAGTSAGGSLRVTLACDTGAAVALAPVPVTVGPGAEATVAGFNPAGAGCQQAVAVITNDSQTAPNPSSSTARSYTLTAVAAPAATTPVVPAPGTGSSAGSSSDSARPVAAVTPLAPAVKATVSRLVLGKVIARRNGTVVIRARVSGAGTLKATARVRARGSLLATLKPFIMARRSVRPRKAGLVTLRLKPGRKARRLIRRSGGTRKARATLVFTPTTGARRTKTKTVTFRLKR